MTHFTLILSCILLFCTLAWTQPVDRRIDEPIDLDDDYDIEYDIDELIDQPINFYTLPSTNDIITTSYFPQYNHTTPVTLPIDQSITVLILVQNNGQQLYNLSYIQMSLLSAYDTTFHIQNYTLQPLSMSTIVPTHELTIEYKFIPDVSLESTDYMLNGFILFNDTTNKIYKNTVINQRVRLIDNNSSLFNYQSITSILMFTAILCGMVYGILLLVAPKLLSGSNKNKRIATQPTGTSRKKKL